MLLPADYLARPKGGGREGGAYTHESDDEIWNTTLREIATFRKNGQMPTFGLTEGRYYYMKTVMKSNAALRFFFVNVSYKLCPGACIFVWLVSIGIQIIFI